MNKKVLLLHKNVRRFCYVKIIGLDTRKDKAYIKCINSDSTLEKVK